MNSCKKILLEGVKQHEAELFYESLIAGLTLSGVAEAKDKIRIEKVITRGDIENMTNYLFVIMASSGIWFSKKWADEYLWPQIKNKIDKPSIKLATLIARIFKD